MTAAWASVPAGHRGRDYQYQNQLVRCVCVCRWRCTLAPDLHRAYLLWCVHIRQVVSGGR